MKHARNNWVITDKYNNTAVAKHFQNLDQVFNCIGEAITIDSISQVIKTTIGDKSYYVKRYYFAGKGFRRFFGRSRISAEWENLITFAGLGVATPNIVGYGQRVELGQFKFGALITEEVVDSNDLSSLVKTQPEIINDKQWRLSVINQVADYIRKIHDAGYVHGNLNWRNILVTLNGEPQIYFIDCPAGGLRKGQKLQKERRNDLAFLDKLGRIYLKPTDQLRFYKRYRQITNLSDTDKQEIASIIKILDNYRLRKKAQLSKKNKTHG